MAGKGRPPTPQHVLKLVGSRKGRRMHGRVPVGKPTCPLWLPSAAKKVFKQTAAMLVEAGVLTAMDQMVLAAYATAVVELQEATELLAKQGRTCTSEAGTLKTHPAVGMQRSAMGAIRLLGAALGLSPDGRLRLHVATEQGGAEERQGVGPRVRQPAGPSPLTPPVPAAEVEDDEDDDQGDDIDSPEVDS